MLWMVDLGFVVMVMVMVVLWCSMGVMEVWVLIWVWALIC